MVTGVQLLGPEEICYDFRACSTKMSHKIPQKMKAPRRRASVRKFYKKETGLQQFFDAMYDIYGESPTRTKVKKHVRLGTIKAITKMLHRPICLASVIRAKRVAASRASISAGAPEHELQVAAEELRNLHNKLNLQRTSYSSIRGHSKIFVATVVSKAGNELEELDRIARTNVAGPAASVAKYAHIPETLYAQFGIPCRAMSKLWREIKSAASCIHRQNKT